MASNRLGGSDTQASRQQAERKGRTTAEYKKVKENMDGFIRTIQSIPHAVSFLTTKFMEAEWLPTHVREIAAYDLFMQALNRIENDADEHQVFLTMIRGITGTDQIVTMLNVIEEESNPIQSSDDSSGTSAMGRSKHANVSGIKKIRLADNPPIRKNASSQVECDSGNAYITPDRMPMDVEPSFAPMCSSTVQYSHHTPARKVAVVSPLPLNTRTNINSIPEGPRQGNVEDTNAPVLTSSESDTTEAQQSHTAECPPSSTTRPNSEAAQAESEDKTTEQCTDFTPMPETLHLSQELHDEAAKYLSSDMINKLKALIKQNEKLKQQLKEEVDAKEAIKQQMEECNAEFTKYQKTAMEKEEAARTEIQKMENELEKCRERISEAEREKTEMESEHKKTCAKLEEEIACLKQKMDNEKMKTELEMLRLQAELSKAEKELAEKEIVILKKEKEIEMLDKKIVVDSKNAKIQKLKRKIKDLRRE